MIEVVSERKLEGQARPILHTKFWLTNEMADDYVLDLEQKGIKIISVTEWVTGEVVEQARFIIQQLATAPAELDDERLSYMTIQVDRDLIERAKRWLEGGAS